MPKYTLKKIKGGSIRNPGAAPAPVLAAAPPLGLAAAEETIMYTPSISDIMESRGNNSLFDTYKKREAFYLINISYYCLTTFLHVFIVYLENMPNEILKESNIIFNCKDLLKNINIFKSNYNKHLLYSSIIPTEIKEDINTKTQNINDVDIQKILLVTKAKKLNITNKYNEVPTNIPTMNGDNYNNILADIAGRIFHVANIIFNDLIISFDTIEILITSLSEEEEKKKHNDLIYNIIEFIIYTKIITKYFSEKAKNPNQYDNILYVTTQNTISSLDNIHRVVFDKIIRDGGKGRNFLRSAGLPVNPSTSTSL